MYLSGTLFTQILHGKVHIMPNELHQKAATGINTPRKATAKNAGEFCGHLIAYYKQQGITGAQAARLLTGKAA